MRPTQRPPTWTPQPTRVHALSLPPWPWGHAICPRWVGHPNSVLQLPCDLSSTWAQGLQTQHQAERTKKGPVPPRACPQRQRGLGARTSTLPWAPGVAYPSPGTWPAPGPPDLHRVAGALRPGCGALALWGLQTGQACQEPPGASCPFPVSRAPGLSQFASTSCCIWPRAPSQPHRQAPSRLGSPRPWTPPSPCTLVARDSSREHFADPASTRALPCSATLVHPDDLGRSPSATQTPGHTVLRLQAATLAVMKGGRPGMQWGLEAGAAPPVHLDGTPRAGGGSPGRPVRSSQQPSRDPGPPQPAARVTQEVPPAGEEGRWEGGPVSRRARAAWGGQGHSPTLQSPGYTCQPPVAPSPGGLGAESHTRVSQQDAAIPQVALSGLTCVLSGTRAQGGLGLSSRAPAWHARGKAGCNATQEMLPMKAGAPRDHLTSEMAGREKHVISEAAK